MATRVVVAGISGRTGREIARAIASDPTMELVGALGGRSAGVPLTSIVAGAAEGIVVGSEPSRVLEQSRAEVLVDFTVAGVAERNVEAALKAGVAPVIGTTGLGAVFRKRLAHDLKRLELGGALISNFSLGAQLLIRLCALTRELLPDAEIIELHGAHKKDRPSGSALALKARLERIEGPQVPIHSVRLPGLVAHQQVLFGGTGEVLSIRHDAMTRDAYAPGVLRTIPYVRTHPGLIEDLEPVLAGEHMDPVLVHD